MAELQSLAPKPLPPSGVDLPEDWRAFQKKLRLFLNAIGKDTAGDKVKIGLLLRTVGSRGKDIHDNFTYPTGKGKTVYKDVIVAFDGFCKPRVNLFNAGDQFMSCKQNNKAVDEYVTELRKLARYCEFPNIQTVDFLMLHIIVMGLDNKCIVEKVKESEAPTLANVIEMVQRSEAKLSS